MNNISFKSNIRPVTLRTFYNESGRISTFNAVNAPWTPKETVIAPSAYTKDIIDCVACGITDGAKVLLMHICPTIVTDFFAVKKFLLNNLNLNDKNLQGFLLGSQKNNIYSPNSTKYFDSFADLLTQFKIPFTELKGNHDSNGTHVAYMSQKDEWLISNNLINENFDNFKGNHKGLLNDVFDKVTIATCDDIV